MPNYESLLRSAQTQEITVAQPAAGAEWSLTVPAGQTWRIETLFFTLTTSAVVANRIVLLTITDGTNVVWKGGSNANNAASGVYGYGLMRLGPNAPVASNALTSLLSLPDIWLPAGYTLSTVTLNRDVADQYSAIRGLGLESTDL